MWIDPVKNYHDRVIMYLEIEILLSNFHDVLKSHVLKKNPKFI